MDRLDGGGYSDLARFTLCLCRMAYENAYGIRAIFMMIGVVKRLAFLYQTWLNLSNMT